MLNFKNKLHNVTSSTLTALLSIILCALPHTAAARDVDLNVVAAAENIAILSQSVVKNYYYVGENLSTSRSGQKLSEEIKAIDSSLATLAASPNYEDLQDDFSFIEMIWTDLKATLAEPYSRDNGLLIIDMGEVMLEGSENLTKVLYKSGVKDSNMIDVIENQRYLVERMAKLYIVSIAGLKDFNVEKQTAAAVSAFDEGLGKIENKKYPESVAIKVSKLRKRWDSSRDYYLNVKEGDLPKTIFFNTEMIERLLGNIFNHHKG